MTPSREAKFKQHARKFRDCSKPSAVLQKYASKSEGMAWKELHRCITHVCAWVALAEPLLDAAKPIGDKNLSPVHVLTKMLGLRRPSTPLDDDVRAALQKVLPCCKVALESESCHHKEDWLKLKKSLPPNLGKEKQPLTDTRKRKQPLTDNVDTCNAEPLNGFDVESTELLMSKRVRRFNHELTQWQDCTSFEKWVHVVRIYKQFERILMSQDVDTFQLHSLLYQVVGFLDAPQARSQSNGKPVVDDRLMTSTKTQSIVREILARGVNLWKHGLLLENLQIEPILGHTCEFIENFEKLHGHVQQACAGKQWQTLKVAAGLS